MPFTLGYKISYNTVISTEALKLFRRYFLFLSRFLDFLKPLEKKKFRLKNFISRLSTNNSVINSYYLCIKLHPVSVLFVFYGPGLLWIV